MRKNIFIAALALISAAALTSCVREDLNPVNTQPEGNGVNFTITTGETEVKTGIDESNAPYWHSTDQLGVLIGDFAAESALAGTLTNTSEQGKTATFAGEATLTAGTNKVYAFYPARAFTQAYENKVVGLEFPYVQFPATASTFDPKADLLAGVPQDITIGDGQTSATVENMRFRRIGSILKVVLSSSALESEKINSVTLTSGKTPLSGEFLYDFVNEDAASTPMSTYKNYVTANLTRLGENRPVIGDPIYIIVPPCSFSDALTINVKTENYEVEKEIPSATLKFPSSGLVTLNVDLNSCTPERVYFQDNFDWLYYWMDTMEPYMNVGPMDPIGAQSTANQSQPNIWNNLSDSVGADVTNRGYEDLCPSNKTLYVQENYLKLGKGNAQTGIKLPPIEFGEEPIDVALSFDWAAHDIRTNVVVEVLNAGECYPTGETVSSPMAQATTLKWVTQTVILTGVTSATRILIRPNLDSYTTTSYYRWWLDDIKVAEIDLNTDIAAKFPVVWSMPHEDNLTLNEDYLVGELDSGSYLYSDTHEGKMTVIRPSTTKCNNSTYGWRDNSGVEAGALLHYGMNMDAYWLFDVYNVNNPAGTYNIQYKMIASAAGPKFFVIEYSLDEGETWTAVNAKTESWYLSNGALYGDVTYTYVLSPVKNEANEICEVNESFTIGAFEGFNTLKIRARVSSQMRENASDDMAGTSGGTNRIFERITISFTPNAN